MPLSQARFFLDSRSKKLFEKILSDCSKSKSEFGYFGRSKKLDFDSCLYSEAALSRMFAITRKRWRKSTPIFQNFRGIC